MQVFVNVQENEFGLSDPIAIVYLCSELRRVMIRLYYFLNLCNTYALSFDYRVYTHMHLCI